MGALVTNDSVHAAAALAQLEDQTRFGAAYGPTNVARSHPSYDPEMYWRGAAWPQPNYLLWVALLRWNRTEEAERLGTRSRQSARRSGWAEYWDPETGKGLGAIPQTWTALVDIMTIEP